MEHENISAPKRAKGVRNPQDYHGYKKNTVSIESAKLKIPKVKKTQFTISKFNQLIFSSEYTDTIKAYDYIDGLTSHTFVVGSSSQPPTMLQNPAYTSDRIYKNKH